jgi:transcriptional regulator with XRE-family HTH domain
MANNKFYKWLNELIENRNAGVSRRNGISISEIAKEVGVDRYFMWQISQNKVLKQRRENLRKIAKFLSQPLSKLEFLAGFNPWCDMPLSDQIAIWKFGILVRAKREKTNGREHSEADMGDSQ